MSAQTGTVNGKVLDARSGDPVKGANVVIQYSQTRFVAAVSDATGFFELKNVTPGTYTIKTTAKDFIAEATKNVKVVAGQTTTIDIYIAAEVEVTVVDEVKDIEVELNVKEEMYYDKKASGKVSRCKTANGAGLYYDSPGAYAPTTIVVDDDFGWNQPQFNTESYDKINENEFLAAKENPLSTFSVDVDRASYANMRRFIQMNQLPPKDAVRIEELVNYFDYTYPQPTDEHPFSITMEAGECPWNQKHDLVMIGLKGKEIASDKLPPSNLVFLIDVSGSMSDYNKLPLLKQSFKVMVDNLRAEDRVAIVVYAGAAGQVLASTPGSNKTKIMNAIDNLSAGGSTAGGEGIELAYKLAKDNFMKDGNNRVILATDGDFNVGTSSDGELERIIEKKREDGIFLTILGFGMGNYKDSKMEKLSNAGNGNYAYIDNILEAKKTLGKEIWGTLFTIAKDVKIQIEFNPAKVKAYRLIGYENRMLKKEDFNDDKKDAGDIGAGHTVTAFYEIIPADSDEKVKNVDELEYQTAKVVDSENLMTVKLRYKAPDGDVSKLIVQKIKRRSILNSKLSENFRFAAAVAEFGILIRDSEFKANASFADALSLAKGAKGSDNDGYRAEFIRLIEIAELLQSKTTGKTNPQPIDFDE
ncbi:MAG: von Willebrand factor type A domain-containing protein [Bacteroidetes bacterium]|nr:von Willebrand factor type A domain-containing protein [Bacteroidota bacterium]MBU1720273.1 von Willebrand factor type A domain-containing protein [Bacteroidota bacterium]